MGLKGKTALITGGTKNLGYETAKAFAEQGVDLFLQYRSGPSSEADKVVSELEKFGVKVGVLQTALDNASDAKKLFDAAKKYFGSKGIDIAVNNIGKVVKKPIIEISEKEFEESDTANNRQAFYFLAEAGRTVNDNGRVITLVTSLLAAYVAEYGVYQGTKAPVEFYSKAASKEWHSRGITSNCVAPGPMDTPFLHTSEKKQDVDWYSSVGLGGRLTETGDIVPIIKFLADEGSWITGQTIYASGGFTAH